MPVGVLVGKMDRGKRVIFVCGVCLYVCLCVLCVKFWIRLDDKTQMITENK